MRINEFIITDTYINCGDAPPVSAAQGKSFEAVLT